MRALHLTVTALGFVLTVTGCGLGTAVGNTYNSITPDSALEKVGCTDLGLRAGDNDWYCIWGSGKALCSESGMDGDENPCDPSAPYNGLIFHANTKVAFTWLPIIGETTGACKVSYMGTAYETPDAQKNTRLNSNVAAYGILNMNGKLEFYLQSPGVICTAPPKN